MNGQPHSHAVIVIEERGWWRIRYGDQDRWFEKLKTAWYVSAKPTEEQQVAALRNHIAKVIEDHDRASIAAERRDALLKSAIPVLSSDRWGSDQIERR